MPDTWDRSFCPLCSTIWEISSKKVLRYVSSIAVPVPPERACPMCAKGKQPVFKIPLPIFPEDDCNWERVEFA